MVKTMTAGFPAKLPSKASQLLLYKVWKAYFCMPNFFYRERERERL